MNSRLFAITDLTSKLRRKQNAQILVSNFIYKFGENQSQMKVVLTDLVFNCCKISAYVPTDLIEANDFDGIQQFVERMTESKTVNMNTTVSLANYWSNALLFFENFWAQNWNKVVGEDLGCYFEKLVTLLCGVEIPSLRFCSVQIKLKFFTSFLKNKPETFEQLLVLVRKYANRFLKCAVQDKCRQIWHCCIKELGKWFSLENELLTDEFFRFIVWSLKDQSINVVLAGLQVVSDVFQSSPPNLLEEFARQVSTTFTSILTSNCNAVVFQRISKCCLQLSANFENAVPNEVTLLLESHLFDIDGRKSKAAAEFWVAVNLGNQLVDSLRAIIKFLCGQKSLFIELFVDSLKDACSLITDWETLAQVLADGFEDKLTAEEKEILIVVVGFAVQQSVTEDQPFLRMRAAGKDAKNEINEDISKEITKAFLPYLEYILATEYQNYAVLLKIISFFHFRLIKPEKLRNLITSCALSFQLIVSYTVRYCALEVISKIQLRAETAIHQLCIKTMNNLVSSYKKKFVTALQNLLTDPEKYLDVDEQLSVSEDLVGMHLLCSLFPIGDTATFNTALTFLKSDLPALWNPVFIQAREICVSFSTKCVTQRIEKISHSSVAFTKRTLEDCITLIYWFTAQLKALYYGLLGEIVFFSLCELAKSLSSLPKDNKLCKSIVFPEEAMDTMAVYLIVVSCNPGSVSSGAAISDVRKRALVEQYLQMIKLDLFPLTYANDVLRCYCDHNNEQVFEEPLIFFLQSICKTYNSETVSNWLFALLVHLFESAKVKDDLERTLTYTERISELIYAVKSEMCDAMCSVHKFGIDYAFSSFGHIQFLDVLTQLQRCLDKSSRLIVFAYLMEKPALDTAAMKRYVNSFIETKTGELRPPSSTASAESSPNSSIRSYISAADLSSDRYSASTDYGMLLPNLYNRSDECTLLSEVVQDSLDRSRRLSVSAADSPLESNSPAIRYSLSPESCRQSFGSKHLSEITEDALEPSRNHKRHLHFSSAGSSPAVDLLAMRFGLLSPDSFRQNVGSQQSSEISEDIRELSLSRSRRSSINIADSPSAGNSPAISCGLLSPELCRQSVGSRRSLSKISEDSVSPYSSGSNRMSRSMSGNRCVQVIKKLIHKRTISEDETNEVSNVGDAESRKRRRSFQLE